MDSAMSWVARLGIDPQRLAWVVVAVAGVALVWGIGRGFEWLLEIRRHQMEHAARLQMLELWARNAQVEAVQAHGMLGMGRVARQGTIHDEITKVGSPTKTSITALVAEVGALAEENFEQRGTEVQVVGTSVLGARARRLFGGKGG